jgi:spore maturation protein CgeB
MWEIMAAGGAVCLQQHSAGLDAVTGLKAGVHYAEWRTFDELRDLIAYYLAHPEEASTMARRAYAEVHRNHSFDARVNWLLSEGMEHAYSGVTAHRERSAV